MESPSFLAAHRGELAALSTALCWSVTPFFFTAAARRVGPFSANTIRLAVGTLLLAAAALASGSLDSVSWRQSALLAASGFVGLTIGDAALFEALLLLGPRRVSLLMATAPVLVAVLSLPLLGETMSTVGVLGMAMTLGGVAWVVMERGGGSEFGPPTLRGVAMGLAAAAGQGCGVLLGKAGLGVAREGSLLAAVATGGAEATSVSPLLAALIRMVAGTLGMIALAAAAKRLREVWVGARDRRAFVLSSAGAVLGPFVGMWLSLAAVKWTREAAVAQTIMGSSPVFVIAIARVVHGERPSARAVLGSLCAVLGLAVLAFREEIAALSG